MMQRAHGVGQLVVIKKSQLVVNLSTTRAVIERGLVQIDSTRKISLGRFGIRVLHQLRVARSAHAITAR